MRIAYADPPYPGQAEKHYGDDPRCAEVDHAELIARLNRDYDGWALSSGADIAAMQYVVPLLPVGTRICAWVKPFASFKPNVTLAYAWEPVFVKPARNRSRELPTVRDWVAANITLKKGTHGAKPDAFSFWLFDALGMEPGDVFDDVFPGSGAVSEAWAAWSGVPRASQVGLFGGAA